MQRLFSTCAVKIKNSWVSSMERKWGKQGHPFEDEEGRPRGRTPLPGMQPGPRTQAQWRRNEAALGEAVKAGAVPADEANAVYAARPRP